MKNKTGIGGLGIGVIVLFLIFAGVLMSVGVEVGDGSDDCVNGQIIIIENEEWTCKNLSMNIFNTINHSINISGNISADYFFGNGSQLSDLPTPDLTDYWRSDGTSTATGEWNLSRNNIKDIEDLYVKGTTYVNGNVTDELGNYRIESRAKETVIWI